jgi:energy-coupling factor transport system ATP-binding protein
VGSVALVKVENLTYAYGGAESSPVLQSCSLSVEPGEMVLLVGPSGCGKSTLLRALNGLVPHFYGGVMSGRVLVDGRDTRMLKPSDLADRIGCVFQDPEAQLVTSTVYEEVVFGLENIGVRPGHIPMRAHEALSAMGASHLIGRSTRELSGGEMQRVALAAALAMRPAVLVLDEPTSQLDPAAAESLLELLRRVNEESGIAVVIAEHRLERCYHWADRVVVMAGGRILSDASPEESARWSVASGDPFVPPVARLFAEIPGARLPLTVKDGRAELARLLPDFAATGLAAPPALPDAPPARRVRWPFGSRADDGPEPLVDIRNLRFTYPDGLEALKDCTLSIAAGECVSIMGDNGAGKSTLIRHFIGLSRADSGSVRLLGRLVGDVPTEQLAGQCALLGQDPNDYLFRNTVTAELHFSLDNLKPQLDAADRQAAVAETLSALGIAELADDAPRTLSAGQRQRVAIAAMAVADPRVLVLDEPTRGLDWDSKVTLGRSLKRLQERGVTVVVVTHDVEFAATFADRTVVMGGGRILADGPTVELLSGTSFLAPQVSRVFGEFADRVVTVEAGRVALTEALGCG